MSIEKANKLKENIDNVLHYYEIKTTTSFCMEV